MAKPRVFLSGHMKGEKASSWRIYAQQRLQLYGVSTVTPVNLDKELYRERLASDRALLIRELTFVQSADLILANFVEPRVSIGAVGEIALAFVHHIPVVTVGADAFHDHPYVRGVAMCDCADLDEAIKVVVEHFSSWR